jgi:hypothetical protein
VKERPIIFSAPMVRAILDGRKTQTRRIVKPSPGRQSEWLTGELINSVPHGEIIDGGWQMHHPRAGTHYAGVDVGYDSPLGWVKCPYGKPGDRLWVREAWGYRGGSWFGAEPEVERIRLAYREDGSEALFVRPVNSYNPSERRSTEQNNSYWHSWRSSIHMPRFASRITLEITDVRVQRLQEISEDDAKAEGAEWYGVADLKPNGDLREGDSVAYRAGFHDLWSSINGKENYQSNPWVWALTFRRLEVA